MKISGFFKPNKLVAFTLLAGSLLIVGCDNDDDLDDDNMYTVSGNASGAQEVPPVSTGATATLTGTYNANTNLLQYNINWTGLSGVIVAAHFHGPAAVGISAPPIHDITIGTNGIAGSTSGSITLHDSTEAHLLAGNIYYNLHTAANVGGEVRAQVVTASN